MAPKDSRIHLSLLILALCCVSFSARAAAADQPASTIVIDGNTIGRTFDGIGGVSAGASSRLLIDYPEPQRSQILDYLFKPDYGAAFQHLKVEVGGDVNSTDGCEPSHMHIRSEENDDRGYEWWLMAEAQMRNPNIILDCLAWGAPAWIGGGKYYSQDMADYLARFLLAAKKKGLPIRFVGVWNERHHDANWIVLLRDTLDRAGLKDVGIVAADEIGKGGWKIVDEMAKDSKLNAAVAVVGVHYPKFASTQPALDCRKPLWSTEDGPWNGTWGGARALAQMFNRNYVVGRMTATEVWSPITSYYDNLPLPGSGVMKANTPWSGYYEVQPALWATAHTTQFAQPGWKYLDSACSQIDGGSIVALQSPSGVAYSVIIESTQAKGPATYKFILKGNLPDAPLHVWRTNREDSFVELSTITPVAGAFSLTIDPESLYSLTTTTGQHKGDAQPPAAKPFSLPFTEGFDDYPIGATPRFTSDQAGIFEVVARSDGHGKSLRQVIDQKGIEWDKQPFPETVLGSADWTDYDVSTDALIEQAGFAALYSRVGKIFQNADPPTGYGLKLNSNGEWQLIVNVIEHPTPKKTQVVTQIIASGSLDSKLNTTAPATGVSAAGASAIWHHLQLSMRGSDIEPFIDGRLLAHATDSHYAAGMIALGSDWSPTQFDNLKIDSNTKQP